jgi:hypothetical protein
VDGEVGIKVKSEEGDEFLLKLDDIKKIGDVILLKAKDDEKESEPVSTEKQHNHGENTDEPR